jgi:hypothetical protein
MRRGAKGSNAKIGVTKIVTLGRKRLLVAEFESKSRPSDGEYRIAQIKVVNMDAPERADKRTTVTTTATVQCANRQAATTTTSGSCVIQVRIGGK